MANKIFYRDQIPSAISYIASSQATNFEKRYIEDDSPATVWRTTGIVGQFMRFDFGSPIPLAGFCWANSNIESGDPIFRIRGGNSLPIVTSTQDLDKQSSGSQSLGWTYRYAEVQITKATGSYVQFGKMMLAGSEYEFEKAYSIGGRSGLQSFFQVNEAKYGQNDRKILYSRFQENVNFRLISKEQRDKFDVDIRPETHIFYFNERLETYYCTSTFGLPAFVTDGSQDSKTTYEITMSLVEAK